MTTEMTRDEAIELLEKEKVYMIGHGGDRQAKALDMAIRAVNEENFKDACIKQLSKKQESVLDNIRAEIWDLQYGDEEKNMTDEDRADAYNNAIIQAIEIIDKYKIGE